MVSHQLAQILEGQPDRVEALDHAVVQVLADALPLGDDRDALQLGAETRVLHGDSRVAGERLHDPDVVCAEVLRAFLLGHVEVPDRATLHRHGRSEEAVHGWMVWREPRAAIVRHHIVDADGAVLRDDHAKQPVALRERADGAPDLIGHSTRDETLHVAVVADDAQSGVLGAREGTHQVHDQLEQGVQRRLGSERDGLMTIGGQTTSGGVLFAA